MLQGEDSVRSQYLPPEPSVKILKRPSKEERLSIAAAECLNGSRPMKTLRQREAEYAEARLRIMGNSSAPDEELNNWYIPMDLFIGLLFFLSRSSSFDAPQPPPPTATYRLLRPPLNDTPGQDIIRSPRGPTDAPGFAIRR